jgi:hypothetical protein
MLNKDSSILEFQQALIRKFGPDIFTPVDPDRLGSNHLVFRCRSNDELEFSVVAEADHPGHFSIQVEAGIDQPDFDIPEVRDHLSLDETLAIFSKYATPA